MTQIPDQVPDRYQPNIKEAAKTAVQIFEEQELNTLLTRISTLFPEINHERSEGRTIVFKVTNLKDEVIQLHAAVMAVSQLKKIAEHGLDKNQFNPFTEVAHLLNLTESTADRRPLLPIPSGEGGNSFRSLTNFVKDYEKDLLQLYQEQLQDELQDASGRGGELHQNRERIKRAYAERVHNYQARLTKHGLTKRL